MLELDPKLKGSLGVYTMPKTNFVFRNGNLQNMRGPSDHVPDGAGVAFAAVPGCLWVCSSATDRQLSLQSLSCLYNPRLHRPRRQLDGPQLEKNATMKN